jgi:hypothetical protein
MAGSVRLLIPLFLCTAAVALAEPPPGGPPHKRPWMKGEDGRPFDGTPSPELENVRKAIEALTPEQRKRFQDNFWRWANLPPEEKKALRDRDEIRRKFMRDEVEAALKESGLQLEGDRKAEFIKRYGEERRKIEEQLREEMAAKRKPLVRELLGKLKAEFSAPPSAPSPATPQP